ncbi:hypothetical protein RF11_06408 [Thelohanellus kitauei]|uniref:Uncharacterized protein n=1 Tax=Thelohanellus kitauei TaxID=669202 RepID=A0A0C2JT40_THEKT|nr:hypothetical protein RF11_06408 [Thelohanellus kitauei]
MLFDLNNVPATFERTIDKILWKNDCSKVIEQLDDTISEEYLGCIISEERVKSKPNKTAYLPKWETPQNVKHIQKFLGSVSSYRPFIKNFGELEEPLLALTRKNNKFEYEHIRILRKSVLLIVMQVQLNQESSFQNMMTKMISRSSDMAVDCYHRWKKEIRLQRGNCWLFIRASNIFNHTSLALAYIFVRTTNLEQALLIIHKLKMLSRVSAEGMEYLDIIHEQVVDKNISWIRKILKDHSKYRIVVPEAMIHMIMSAYHDKYGNFAVRQALSEFSRGFIGLFKTTVTCVTCYRNDAFSRKTKVPRVKLNSSRVLERVGIDIFGQVYQIRDHCYILESIPATYLPRKKLRYQYYDSGSITLR